MKSLQVALILLLSLTSLQSLAQTEPGKTFIGGNTSLDLDFSNTKYKVDQDKIDGGGSSSFELSPQIGKFAALNFAVGGVLPISVSTEKDENDGKFTTSTWAIGPFTRLYFGEDDTKFFLHAMGGIGSYTIKSESSYGSEDRESGGLGVYQLGAGVAFFIHQSISLDLLVNYNSTTMNMSESDVKIIYKGLNIGFGFNFIL